MAGCSDGLLGDAPESRVLETASADATAPSTRGEPVNQQLPPSRIPTVQDLVGAWRLTGNGGARCLLTLSSEAVEPRAAGSLPAPMNGARQEGDCGLDRRIGGWRLAGGGALELADQYGASLVVLRRVDDAFSAEDGLTLTRQ